MFASFQSYHHLILVNHAHPLETVLKETPTSLPLLKLLLASWHMKYEIKRTGSIYRNVVMIHIVHFSLIL